MARKSDNLGTLAEGMAASILQKVACLPALDPVERVHFLYAVFDRCEDGGRVTPA